MTIKAQTNVVPVPLLDLELEMLDELVTDLAAEGVRVDRAGALRALLHARARVKLREQMDERMRREP